jgi:beta-glucosidase-like glycosyl hydrolase
MCSYNSINGVPSCANKWLLGELLRGTWNFSGYVTSDSGAINDIYSSHHYTRNWTQTVTKALEAGCDIESANWKNDEPWATGGKYIDYGPAAIRSGELDEKVPETALHTEEHL